MSVKTGYTTTVLRRKAKDGVAYLLHLSTSVINIEAAQVAVYDEDDDEYDITFDAWVTKNDGEYVAPLSYDENAVEMSNPSWGTITINSATKKSDYVLTINATIKGAIPVTTGSLQGSSFIDVGVKISETDTVYNTLTITTFANGSDGAPGEPGESGAVIRPCGEWSNAKDYVCNAQYIDVVIKGEVCYQCIKNNGISSTIVEPPNTDCWKAANMMDFVATRLLMSEMLYADVLQAVKAKIDELVVNRLQTYASGGANISLEGGVMKVGLVGSEKPNIIFGISNGYAVLQYYDNDGKFLYNLGPDGIMKEITAKDPYFTDELLRYIGTTKVVGTSVGELKDRKTYSTCHEWHTGYKSIASVLKYCNPDELETSGDMKYNLDSPSKYDYRIYKNYENLNPTKCTSLSPGYYRRSQTASYDDEVGGYLVYMLCVASDGSQDSEFWIVDEDGDYIKDYEA